MTTAPEPPRQGVPPQPATPAGGGGPLEPHQITRTRAGGFWIASIAFAILLLLLLIFILQNSEKVQISFFGLDGKMPLGVALLLSAVLGVLLVVIPGTLRIVQLRLLARRHTATDNARLAPRQAPGAPAAPPASPATPRPTEPQPPGDATG